MKKISLFGLGATAVALTLAACSVGDTDKGTTEIATFDDLPECSANKDLSGVSLLGTKLYVEDDDTYYLCTEKGWVESDSSAVPEVTPTEYVVDSATVVGTAKLGGSFVRGSKVTLREVKIDQNKKEFVATGTEFADEVSSDRGAFVIPEVHLYYDYALVEVKGKFYDMKTGETSEEEVTLVALADLKDTASTSINVNLISTLQYARIQTLVKDGYSVSAAKKQAEKEIWNALGFAGEVENESAAMAALEILLRQNEGIAEFVKAVEAFAEDVGKDGSWEDDDAKIAMADFAFNFLNNKLKDDDNRVVYKENDLLRNLAKFGVDAPAFHSYLVKYWNMAYGLNGCGASRRGAVVKNVVDASDSADAYFICKTIVDPVTGEVLSSLWDIASNFERDTVGLGDDVLDGTIASGNLFPEYQYVYDTTGTGEGDPARWLPIAGAKFKYEGRDDAAVADSIILVIGKQCTDYEDVRYSMTLTVDESGKDTTYYGCNNRKWASSYDKYEYKIGTLCSPGMYELDKVLKVDIGDQSRYFYCDSTITEKKNGSDTTWAWAKGVSKQDYEFGLCDSKHLDILGLVKKVKEKTGSVESDAYYRCSYTAPVDPESDDPELSQPTYGWKSLLFDDDMMTLDDAEATYAAQDEKTCDKSVVKTISSKSCICEDAVTDTKKIDLYYNWKKASDVEASSGLVCTKANVNKTAELKKEGVSTYYVCKANESDPENVRYDWTVVAEYEYYSVKNSWSPFKAGDLTYATKIFEDEKSGVKAKCVETKDGELGEIICTKWTEASAGDKAVKAACSKLSAGKTAKIDTKEYKCSYSFAYTNASDEVVNALASNSEDERLVGSTSYKYFVPSIYTAEEYSENIFYPSLKWYNANCDENSLECVEAK